MASRTHWAWLSATLFGIGYLRPGPGTYGSVATGLLWLAAAHSLKCTTFQLGVGTLFGALLLTVAGVRASTLVARESGRNDPSFVVIDEAAGQLVALIGLYPSLRLALLGLLLFRLFDIFKPWPIRKLEALPEGTGIMFDDLAAGALACVCAHLLVRLGGLAP